MGRPGVLQSMGSQRVDTTEWLNNKSPRLFPSPWGTWLTALLNSGLDLYFLFLRALPYLTFCELSMLRSNRLKKRKLTDCVTWAESNTITYLEGLKDRLDVIRRESETALKKKKRNCSKVKFLSMSSTKRLVPQDGNRYELKKGFWKRYGRFWLKQVSFPCMCARSLQSYPTLGNPMDCSPPGSSVHGILQARTLEWAVIPFFRESSWHRDWTHISYISYVSCIGWWVLYH